jgi:peptide-methionine (S)-S-oxide reductase
VRTRVGYAGGSKANPTYHDLGDHTEVVQLEYDPSQISYDELLAVFWRSHAATAPSFSQQYASLILYHNDEQRRLAEQSKKREQQQWGTIYTEIIPLNAFYQAERYHQKYYLSAYPRLAAALRELYPDHQQFVDATVVTRLNGYAGGHGHEADLRSELVSLGLSDEQSQGLLKLVR